MREDCLIDRLEAADPAADLAPYGEAEMRRQLVEITAIALRKPPRTRRWRRVTVLAAATACAIAVGYALLPSGDPRQLSGPAQALAAQLATRSAIVHFISETPWMRREVWIALDGSGSREITRLGPNGAATETVVGDGSAAVYSERADRLTQYRRLEVLGRRGSALCWPCLATEFGRNVQRGRLSRIGTTVIDGRAAAVLRLNAAPTTRLFVAQDGGALLRIEVGSGARVVREEFRSFEVLDGSPAHRQLLAMAPHPGARVVEKDGGALP